MSEIFSSKTQLFNLEDVNKNIIRYKVPICYAGIANNFDFSKEVIEKMVDTIKGSPVLAYYDPQAKDFGGHEFDQYKSNGVKKRTPPLIPIGFAIYDQDAWWEKFNLDGTEREYYTTFVYLWENRNPELQHLKQVYQSMEVELDYENSEGVIKKVKSASFQGMAMLGSSVLPAFKGSTFIKFSSDDLDILKQEFEQIKLKPSEKLNKKEGKLVNMSVGDKLGKSSAIKINNAKDFAIMSGSWSDPGAGLLDRLLESNDHASLISEAYLVIDGDHSDDLSIDNVHYPHHSLKDGELVVNKSGVESAFARAKQQGLSGEAITHIKKHYKELGLNMDNFADKNNTKKEGEKKVMKDFKAMYSQMKESQSKFCLDDSEDMLCLVDSEAQCIYILDGEGGVTKIPFEVIPSDDQEGEEAFVAKEDAKQEMPDSKEMMMSLAKMSVAEKEKVTTEMSAQLSAKEAEIEAQKVEMSAKDVEIGKAFSSVSSLETALSETKTVMAEREAQIEELSKKLKEKDDAEKMSQVDTLMSKKEFSVFNDEEKQVFKDKASEMPYEQFENMLYSTFGKKVKDNIDFENGSKNFSFMYVDNAPPVHHENKDDKDIYADLREKNNK